MADPALLTRLAQHRALGTAPANEHAWLAEHGVLRAFAVGDVVTRKGESATSLHIMLTGHLVIRVDRGAGSHKIFEWRAGDVGGLMPYSRGASPPADAVTEAPTEVLEFAREQFPEMIRECPVVTGNGLKDVASARKSVGEPFTVNKDLADVKRVASSF